jgi:hypothetical protein
LNATLESRSVGRPKTTIALGPSSWICRKVPREGVVGGLAQSSPHPPDRGERHLRQYRRSQPSQQGV